MQDLLQTLAGVAQGVQPADGLRAAIALVFGVLAVDRVRALLTLAVSEETPQARGKAVTRTMVARLNFAILMFCFFAFYGMIAAIFQLPDNSIWGQYWDFVIVIILLVAVVAPVFMNFGELIDNKRFTLDRAIYQVRLLAKRGVNFSSLGAALLAVLSKLELQGVAIIGSVVAQLYSVPTF